MKLTESELQHVSIPSDVWSQTSINHELCLVGRVLSRKSINLEAFEKTMLLGWNVAWRVKMQKVRDDRILIQFGHVFEKHRVMWRGPWAFDRNLVVLRELNIDDDPALVSLNESEFHVQATGLPITLLHSSMAEVLGNAMGTFLRPDVLEDKWCVGDALRFRVKIDITKPIRRMIHIKGPADQKLCVRLAYENLPNFCYYCGIIGHLVKDCSECLDFAHPSGDIPVERLKYGDWLRTHVNASQPKVVKR